MQRVARGVGGGVARVAPGAHVRRSDRAPNDQRDACASDPALLNGDRWAPLSSGAPAPAKPQGPTFAGYEIALPLPTLTSRRHLKRSRSVDFHVSIQTGSRPVVRDQSLPLLRCRPRLDVIQHLRAGLRLQHSPRRRVGHYLFSAPHLSKSRAAEVPQVRAAAFVDRPIARFLVNSAPAPSGVLRKFQTRRGIRTQQ